MSRTEYIKPTDLGEGDLIDLLPLLNDPSSHPWVWQPDEQARAEAVETARLVAECGLAMVESVEPIDGDKVIVYNDQINVTVPVDHFVTRTVN